jgi:predicted 3-demethylubiquinone-9 3-methyltransferase (glyoxalase superfamily)
MQTITPFLWFDQELEEALDFYVKVFTKKGSAKVLSTSAGPGGQMMSATFELNGQKFMAMNAGPEFKFTEAISFFVECNNQEEVDYYWETLAAGGEKSQCGWLKDKFGLSWQIIPKKLGELLGDVDPVKSKKVLAAMLKMTKIDIQNLQAAYDQK